MTEGPAPFILDGVARDDDLPGIGADMTEEDSQRGAFSRTIMTEEAEDFPPWNVQLQRLESLPLPEAFRDAANLKHRQGRVKRLNSLVA
jgi:hypothetical protein